MLFDPCNKCIVKVMCRDTCGEKIIYANRFDMVTSTATLIFALGLYAGLVVWMIMG